jgi:hypothetical protein
MASDSQAEDLLIPDVMVCADVQNRGSDTLVISFPFEQLRVITEVGIRIEEVLVRR